ncbi:MAG: Lpp/OprI family alanine-zipper lipoprotein [Haliea sp.]|nr:Lpp/OprI family alanine-zipper lipoprotein [Haliea sp.]MDP4918418.1 Lpp/OprI family alanine-zipper lipoprotein [Haliea sp.]MDP5065454.1 Lpp/OprI family alanine-zipper lipoprotein [Haliea sp.]
MTSMLIKAVSIAAFAALATGCASSSQLDEVRSIAEAAQRSADEAKQTAAGAERTAADAKRTAEEAKRSADEANSKIDRAFKTSMQK